MLSLPPLVRGCFASCVLPRGGARRSQTMPLPQRRQHPILKEPARIKIRPKQRQVQQASYPEQCPGIPPEGTDPPSRRWNR